MYTLSVERMISAAHKLNDYPGPCARIHGHNWKIRLEVHSRHLDDQGIAIDFGELDQLLWKVVGPFDHQLMNDVKPFDRQNPTAENLVKYIYDQIKAMIPANISMQRVTVWETDQYKVAYEE